MVSSRQQKQMRDYMVSRLEGSNDSVIPKQKEVIPGVNTDYILIGKTGGVILVNHPYENDGLALLTGLFGHPQNGATDLAFVFFKDGKTFFRNAANGEKAGLKGNRFKADNGLSLKNYQDRMNQIITVRPEEKFLINAGRWVQYYQPESERLEEGLVSFKFGPVTYDYSHIPPGERWGAVYQNAERLRIWNSRIMVQDSLTLKDGHLVRR